MRIGIFSLLLTVLVAGTSCGQKAKEKQADKSMANQVTNTAGLELATFGSGCFWCTEAIFLDVEGVYNVQSG